MSDTPAPRDASGLFQTRYREVTISAIIFAIVIGIVMNAAITYAGLKIGFTIGGSAIAAVLGFGVLRGILRKGTILETNIAQTVASAVNIPNSGIIFTVPVLFLLGIPLVADGTDFWLITLAAIGGALLGTAFIIPLRKQMIDIDRLRFPTGMGVAAILKSPGAGPKKAVVLVMGILVAMVIYWFVAAEQLHLFNYGSLGIPGVTGEEVDVGSILRLPPQFQLVFAIAPFALGAGYITGRAGLLVLAGGILAFFVLTPLAYQMGWMPETVDAAGAPGYGYGAFNRPLGIGLLLGGAMMGVIASLPGMRAAIKSIASASKRTGGAEELSLKPVLIAGLAAVALLYLAADFVGSKPFNRVDPITGVSLRVYDTDEIRNAPDVETKKRLRAELADSIAQLDIATRPYNGYTVQFESEQTASQWDTWDTERRDTWMKDNNAKTGWLAKMGMPSHVRSLVIALVGGLWIWFAGIIIAQCTGMTDWSPISGMALLTVVLIMLLAGTGAVVGSVLIGAALCVAITLAADMMQDLRTGHLIGAQPRRQQIVELGMVWLGPIVSMLTIVIIAAANDKQYGVAFGPETPTTAPQAQALQAVITGVQGGQMPYALYGFGALLGALLGLGAFSGLGVLVGLSMYLPFQYIATYGIGCVVAMALAKIKGKEWAEEWGVPFAAGLIVGEGMLSMIVNMVVLAQS